MAIAQSKLTAQGQISVPAEIRKKLGLGPGSVLEWDERSGEVAYLARQGDNTLRRLDRTREGFLNALGSSCFLRVIRLGKTICSADAVK